MLDAIVDRGAAVHANRVRSRLSTFFKWCMSRDLIEQNPCASVARPTKEAPRDRTLNDDELALLWKAAVSVGWPFGPIVQLLVLTASRKSEIAEGVWSEIDKDRRLWLLPAARSKNKLAHAIPLNRQSMAIIDTLPVIQSQAKLIFTTNGETPVSGFSKAKTQLDEAIKELNGGEPIDHWTIHDIRRSAVSGMARLGVNALVADRLLNHVTGSLSPVARIYQQHDFAAEMRAASDLWGEHVAKITDWNMCQGPTAKPDA